MWNGNSVASFDPNTSSFLSKMEVTVNYIASCSLGEDHLDTICITSASIDMSEIEVVNSSPLADSIFVVTLEVERVEPQFSKVYQMRFKFWNILKYLSNK